MTQHVISVEYSISTEVEVVSHVQLSPAIRRFVVTMLRYLLSELQYKSFTMESFFQVYDIISKTAEEFNENERVSAKAIRNAVRALKLRIQYCKNKREADSELWKTLYSYTNECGGEFYDELFDEEAELYLERKEEENLALKKLYSQSTMVCMERISQLLLETLTFTDEFE